MIIYLENCSTLLGVMCTYYAYYASYSINRVLIYIKYLLNMQKMNKLWFYSHHYRVHIFISLESSTSLIQFAIEQLYSANYLNICLLQIVSKIKNTYHTSLVISVLKNSFYETKDKCTLKFIALKLIYFWNKHNKGIKYWLKYLLDRKNSWNVGLS